jgi:hypothetical protein
MEEDKDDQLASNTSGGGPSNDWSSYKYKRVIVPSRVVVGYLGDFGADIPYLNRGEMLRDIRRSIAFSERWLRVNVVHFFANTRRLRRNLASQTREAQYRDIVQYEQYLRWNVEFRFKSVATIAIIDTLTLMKIPRVLANIVLDFVDLPMSQSGLWYP